MQVHRHGASTLPIDKTGRIAKAWRSISATNHAADVLAAARALP